MKFIEHKDLYIKNPVQVTRWCMEDDSRFLETTRDRIAQDREAVIVKHKKNNEYAVFATKPGGLQ